MKDIQKIKEFFSKPLDEASSTEKFLRKLGWAGEDWTPQEFASQIKKLPDSTLISWAKSNKGIGKGIPNTPLAFQQKLVKIEMDKRGLSLDEAKKETAVDMAKKQLDALGVKYEMSGNEFRPFKAIYKPINKSDKWYDEFDDVIHLFNLGSAVKQSMNEIEYLNPGKRPIITNKQGQKFVIQGFTTSGYYLIPYDGKKYWEPSSVSKDKWIPEKDINWNDYNFSQEQFNNLKAEKTEKRKEISRKFQDMNEAKSEDSYEVVWTDRDYKKHSKVFKNDPKGAPDNAKKKAEAFKKSLEDKDKKSKEGLYRSIDLNEAKEDKVDTITMDIPLFLRMLEYSREDAKKDVDLHDVTEKANKLGKEKGILSMEDYDAIVGAAEDIKEILNTKISKALNKINEELCPAGKAYIKRRQAAGEKSSAYLSGRGVKVCKGQMSGKAKKK